nr:MAG: hypothetical protein DIU74_00485 [Pseudomonadota bacterium]
MKTNRRKLMKGALAAPMIFTLGPTAGWAQAINSAGVCLQKSNVDIIETGGAITDGADQWVRMPIELLQLTRQTEGQEQPVVLEGTYIRSFDGRSYYRVNNGGLPTATDLQVGQQGLSEESVGTAFALVRIDKADPNAPAQITGFAWEPAATGAIASLACANSAGLLTNLAAAQMFKSG